MILIVSMKNSMKNSMKKKKTMISNNTFEGFIE